MHPKPLVPWIGGKRRLAEHILPLLGDPACYVEAFAGAGAIFFAKPPSQCEVLNDVNGELINLYRVVKHHLDEFVRQFRWSLTSRKMFEWQQMTRPETLTDVQRAARFYYLQRLAFGGRVDGQSFGTTTTGGSRLNLLRLEEDLSAAYVRLADTWIENLPWSSCVDRYDRPHTTFFCDPPYWETEGYGVDFPFEEYEALAARAKSIAGTMIITVNDHPDMRRVFADLPFRSVPITYTVGGAAAPAERAELIIGNWKDGWPKPRPLTQQISLSVWE